MLDLLLNAAGGGVVGSVLNLGTRWFDVYAKKKEADIEIARMRAMAEIRVEEMSWVAFGKSQESVNEDVVISEKADQWVINLGELVDCFRSFTRPALTWLLMLVLLIVFLRSNETTQASMAGEITFGSFTALFWWFGSRYGRK
ncbi:MAG: hypothetical protein ACO3EH_00300 [Ilumatobacteraceae bacterium]